MCDQLERASLSPSILFAAGFRVRTYRSPVVAKGSTAIDRVFGLNMPGSFASFCRASSSWKTSQRSFFGGWIVYSDRWPGSGILLGGACYRLKTWERPTFGGGSLSSPGERWPTPNAGYFNEGESPEQWDARKQRNRTKTENPTRAGAVLAVEVKRWPTPTDPKQRLNPEWVELLMGFPPGWTTIGPPEEDQNSTQESRQEPESAGPEIGKG